MTLIYVDVSHHDRGRRGAPLDWARIRAVTSEVMCARATYGDPQRFAPVTRYFAEFQQGARAAGFTLRGGYHNLIRGDASSMRRQVDWFRRELEAQGCDWAMLDIERYAELVANGLWPRFDDVLRFRDAWHAVESRPLAYYLPQWLYNGYYGGADLRQLPGPLVQSHYAGGDGTPSQIYANAGGDRGTGWDDRYGNRLPDIWQYTSSADVDGASSATDVNAYRGTLAQLRAVLAGDTIHKGAPKMFLLKHVQSDAVYVSDGVQTRYIPGGHWDKTCEPLIAAGVPFLKHYANEAEVFAAGGPPSWIKEPPVPTPVALTAEDRAAIVADLRAGLLADLRAEVRDAVADLGERGAAGVRAE